MRKNTDFFQFLVMKGKGLWFVSKSRFLYCSLQHFHNYYKVQTVFKTFVRFDWLRLCLSQSLLTLAITFASSFAVFISPFVSRKCKTSCKPAVASWYEAILVTFEITDLWEKNRKWTWKEKPQWKAPETSLSDLLYLFIHASFLLNTAIYRMSC